MSTTTRPPNKTIGALDEAIGEHDPQLAQRVEALTKQIRREMDEAGRRFDKAAQARLGEMALTVLEVQISATRLQTLHQLARANDYDRR